MAIKYSYHYAGEFKKYIGQFLRIFTGLQVQDGVDRNNDGVLDFRPVNVVYGNMDRVIEKLLQNNATFTNQKIPLISAYFSGVKRADEYAIPKHHVEGVTYLNTATGNYQTATRMAGTPYVMSMDLYLYASNTDQLFQMLEQILLWFNPTINFQTSSSVLDPNYITRCTLTGIQDQSNYPMGTERRIITQVLNFEFVAWLNYPYQDASGMIADIFANIHDASAAVGDLESLTQPITPSATVDSLDINSSTHPEN